MMMMMMMMMMIMVMVMMMMLLLMMMMMTRMISKPHINQSSHGHELINKVSFLHWHRGTISKANLIAITLAEAPDVAYLRKDSYGIHILVKVTFSVQDVLWYFKYVKYCEYGLKRQNI